MIRFTKFLPRLLSRGYENETSQALAIKEFYLIFVDLENLTAQALHGIIAFNPRLKSRGKLKPRQVKPKYLKNS
mgnify:CR=1 FL=1